MPSAVDLTFFSKSLTDIFIPLTQSCTMVTSSVHRDKTQRQRWPAVSKPTSTPLATPRHDWNNLNVLHRNTLPARNHFFLYTSEQDAVEAAQTHDTTKSKSQLLSGTWKFHLADSPLLGPLNFYQQDFDVSGWHDVAVPGMWQLQGFGKGPQYTNIPYPFPCNPPHIPVDDNECGRYVRTFTVGHEAKDHQIRLRFEGVDSAFTVWVNGIDVGYSQGSRNPSEFDITDVVKSTGHINTLAV